VVAALLAVFIFLVFLELITEEVTGKSAAQGTDQTVTSAVTHEVAGSTSGQSRPKTTLALWSIGIEGSIGVLWGVMLLRVVWVVRGILLLAVAWLLRMLA